MRHRDEYNYIRIDNEVDGVPETRPVREVDFDPEEQPSVIELSGYQENGDLGEDESAEKKPIQLKLDDERGKRLKMISLMTATIAGGVVVGVVALPGFTQETLHAEILSLHATGTAIYYEISVENKDGSYYEGDDVKIVVFNEFTKHKVTIEYGLAEGVIEGLKPNMPYTVSVMRGNSTLVKKSITTLQLRQEVRFVEWECRCAEDGYFYFEMDYLDEMGTWTGFKAILEDEYGNVAECAFASAEEQRLDVENSYLRGEIATLTIHASVGEGDAVEWTEIYTVEVEI